MNRPAPPIVVVALFLLSGCVAGPGVDSAPSTTEVACAETEIVNDSLPEEAPSYPEPPAELDAATAADYVNEFETAYAWEERYSSRYDYFSVDVGGVEVSSTGDGYTVDVDRVKISTREERGDRVEAGSDAWSARYYITDEGDLKRSDGNAGAPPSDPDTWTCLTVD